MENVEKIILDCEQGWEVVLGQKQCKEHKQLKEIFNVKKRKSKQLSLRNVIKKMFHVFCAVMNSFRKWQEQ